MENCALRCPSGSDDECPGELNCLSGVTDCKNEMGMSAYMTKEDGTGNETMVDKETTTATSSSKPSRTPTSSSSSSSSSGEPSTATIYSQVPSVGLEQLSESASPVALEEAVASTEEEDTNELQGPFEEDMVRIILYGLDSDTVLADGNTTLNSWKTLTRNYIMDFFNKYPTQEMLDAGDAGSDTVRASLYDVTVVIAGETMDEAPPHDYAPVLDGEIGVENDRRHLRRSASSVGRRSNTKYASSSAARRTQTGIDPSKTVMITYSQSSTYRSPPELVIEDPSIVMRLPLDTSEYRADYVNYLRARDYATFQNLEYASQFLFTEFPTAAPVGIVTTKPTGGPVVPGEPTVAPTLSPTEDFGCNLCQPGQYGVDAELMFNGEASTCMDVYNWFLKNYHQGSGSCKEGQSQLSELCCRDGDGETQDVTTTENEPTLAPIMPNRPTLKPSEVLEIPTDEFGLPDAASLAETYYCGLNWDTVDSNCEDASPCPSGVSSDCPEEEQCIAFTNCGGKFVFVSDPDVEGGGPNADNVKSTFYCGTSVQFLENNCEGVTPCPNGPQDCEGDGEQYGCFAFTGCNEKVDPGSFVGFLKTGAEVAAVPAPSPSNEYSVEDLDLLKSTFFCGTSIEEIDKDCENAIPCPSGDECLEGFGCFAFSQCGGVDISSLVDTFGDTDQPTRAPTVPIEQICDEDMKMSVNVGYWQSWSI